MEENMRCQYIPKTSPRNKNDIENVMLLNSTRNMIHELGTLDVVNKTNAKLILKINNTLSHTLQTFNRITNKCDLQNKTLYKVLADKLYNNMRYANLITEDELEKLIK